MDSSAENTTNNVLRFGVNEAMVDKAIHDSGYPLQLIVAHQLAHDFGLQEEWSYKDADKGTARTIDLVASKLLFDWGKPKLRIRPELVLLIECKQSDLPYVFFLSEIHPWLSEFPTISGLSTRDIKITTDDDPSSWTFTPLHVLELHTHPFLTKAVPFCMTFSKAVRKGEDITLSGSDAYESLVFPILKATSHFDELQHPPSNALYFDCQIVIGVGIGVNP